MRSFEELEAAVRAKHFHIGEERRWQLCGTCQVIPCNPESTGCCSRTWVNQKQKLSNRKQRRKKHAAEIKRKLRLVVELLTHAHAR